ncbi:MAG: fibrobacter succinogenes major paralogous domain-containing protein [Fibrobacter sp.]|nr:fibrobacter succinogenes major paralogous domain-containing protein [Fibrobacter sp.]
MEKRLLTIIAASLLAFALTGCNELKDPRDGKIYRTVKIGKQVWMAENLNYKAGDSYCYEDNPAKCQKYGRLYTWNAAYEACPMGWHLPSKDEYRMLFKTVGGIVDGKYWRGVANNIKSAKGWNNDGNGGDAFGFSVLPAGYRDEEGFYRYEGSRAHFWSSTEEAGHRNSAYGVFLDAAHFDGDSKNHSFSVRCIQN